MKTIKNILGVLLASVAMTSLVSCGEDEPNYTPAETLTNAQVYFPTSNSQKIDLSASETSFEVAIARLNTEGAVTVPLTLVGGDGLYSAPASVSFAQGQSEAKISVGYDAGRIVPNDYKTITLSIADESLTTPYGIADYVLSVGLPETWTARYLGDYTYSLYYNGVDPGLKLLQSDIYPNRWKITDWGSGIDLLFTWNQETNEVLVDDQWMMDHPSYGPLNVSDMVVYTGGSGYGVSTYKDGVFYFNLIYYVEAGNFGYGYETFEITGPIK